MSEIRKQSNNFSSVTLLIQSTHTRSSAGQWQSVRTLILIGQEDSQLTCSSSERNLCVSEARVVPEAVVVGLVLHDGVGWKVQNSS